MNSPGLTAGSPAFSQPLSISGTPGEPAGSLLFVYLRLSASWMIRKIVNKEEACTTDNTKMRLYHSRWRNRNLPEK